jgi:hypothetical protein
MDFRFALSMSRKACKSNSTLSAEPSASERSPDAWRGVDILPAIPAFRTLVALLQFSDGKRISA